MTPCDACSVRLRSPCSRGIAILLVLWGLALAGCQDRWRQSPVSHAWAQGGPPRLLVPESPLDLGQGLPGDELWGSVPLRNGGGQLLRIERIEAGRGCVSISLREPAIAPGTEGQLQVTLRINEEGQHLQFPIRIYSNDPVSPETVCTVRAEAAPALLRTEPTELNFGEVALGTAPVKRIKVFKLDGRAWPAKGPISAEWSHGLALQIDSESPRGKTREDGLVFGIRPRADLLPGSFSDTLTVRPPGSRRGVRIPVQGAIVPRFVLSPSGLYFGEVHRDSGILKRYVLLRRTDGKPVNRIARSVRPPGFKLTEELPGDRARSNDRARLLVTLDSSQASEGVKDGKLFLWLEHEPEPLMIRIMIVPAKKVARSEP